jgi:hypothetical protein
MPTRKQRRRRAKEKRHEYVWEDDEGNEIDPGEISSHKTSSSPSRSGASRPGRQPQAPSWARTFRRALIFLPIMFVVISLLSKNLSLADRALQTLLIGAVFVPFSYFLDGLFWRSYQRRVARAARSNGRRGS